MRRVELQVSDPLVTPEPQFRQHAGAVLLPGVPTTAPLEPLELPLQEARPVPVDEAPSKKELDSFKLLSPYSPYVEDAQAKHQ